MTGRDLPDGARAVRVSVVLLALLCVATGVLAGYLVRGLQERKPTYLEQLTEMLALRPEQVAAIEAVLTEEDREIDALLYGQWQELQAPVAARRERTESALLAALDGPQRARYEQLVSATVPAPAAPGAADQGRR
jgi:hypothetical protein